ncbi:TPA: GpE family phage tail protein [Escherichia coli]|nr:GpE family phage tail protein [Escherichia coli]
MSVDDLMADVAVIFHWPPSELYPTSIYHSERNAGQF